MSILNHVQRSILVLFLASCLALCLVSCLVSYLVLLPRFSLDVASLAVLRGFWPSMVSSVGSGMVYVTSLRNLMI